MSNGLPNLHEIVKDPTRRQILMLIREHNGGLSFDELMKTLQITDSTELYRQLEVLAELVSESEKKYTYTQDGGFSPDEPKYTLTEKGHDALNQMLVLPEITQENYSPSPQRQEQVNLNIVVWTLVGTVLGAFLGFFSSQILSLVIKLPASRGTLLFLVFTVFGGMWGFFTRQKKDIKWRKEPLWNN